MKYLFAFFCIGYALQGIAQTHYRDTVIDGRVAHIVDGKIFSYVEQMPVARYDLDKYIKDHLQYPRQAKAHNVSGKVVVKFVVSTDGTITNYELVKGIGYGCDEEALRLVKNMPPWEPAKQNGRQVPVYYTLPVEFEL